MNKPTPEDELKRGPGRPPIENPAAAHIHLRTTLDRKRAYMKAARPGKLTEWCFKHLDAAAGFDATDAAEGK